MDQLITLLAEYGYVGMLIASFLAGSFFPFSSEAVMVGLVAAGLNPVGLLIYGTIGNVAGSMFNYWVGRMGRLDWIEKYLHVKPEKLKKTQDFMAGRGSWIGILAFLPLFGSALTIAMGLMRANLLGAFISISIGKFVRYALLLFGTSFFF